MVQLGTKRTALVLYCVLLVLPTAVLGGLHWRQLRLDHDSDLASIPRDAQDASMRLMDAIRKSLLELLDREGQRPFYEYSRDYFPPEARGAKVVLVASPLRREQPRQGVLGWFDYQEHLFDGQPEVFGGAFEQLELWPQRHDAILAATTQLQQIEASEAGGDMGWKRLSFLIKRHGAAHEEALGLPQLAVNMSTERDLACLSDALPEFSDLAAEVVQVQVTPFHVRFFVDGDRNPHAIATRLVQVPRNDDLRRMPDCFKAVKRGTLVVQGFVIDTQWLLDLMPVARARDALDSNQEFLGPQSTPPAGSEVAAANLIEELNFEVLKHEDSQPYVLRVAIDRKNLDARLRSRELAFLSVAGMLVLSLGTGLVLLFRSVQRDLEAARRTENFVSAVTHELRTPLSAVKLYGEMLAEGWVTDEAKRQEYYRRILRESTRLETLVERVLHKGQLTRNELAPEPGDLVRAIEPLVPLLSADGSPHPTRDLAFELPAELPMVMLHTECVRSIVTNLVENARKYAPVDPNDAQAEPIRVRVALVERSVRLEVLDRGPGIPPEERSRIFQAFYRIGNERTRASKGTGLGLHLVALQAEAMGAEVEALAREGGGTVFRVSFRLAEEPRA